MNGEKMRKRLRSLSNGEHRSPDRTTSLTQHLKIIDFWDEIRPSRKMIRIDSLWTTERRAPPRKGKLRNSHSVSYFLPTIIRNCFLS